MQNSTLVDIVGSSDRAGFEVKNAGLVLFSGTNITGSQDIDADGYLGAAETLMDDEGFNYPLDYRDTFYEYIEATTAADYITTATG